MNSKEENYINKLTTLYRTDIYETEDVDLNKISNISNDDLKIVFMINNSDMIKLSNQEPLNKEAIQRLLVANINFYKLARSRGMEMAGSSFLKRAAIIIGYDINKLYDELSVGRFERPYKR